MTTTTRTKSKPATYAAMLASAERDYLSTQNKSRETLAAARERLAATESASEAAHDAVTAQASSYARSDDSDTTPESYAAAKVAVELITARAERCKSDLNRAQRASRSVQTEVSEALVSTVQRALPTVPVGFSMLPIDSLPVPALTDLPQVIVSQVSPTQGANGTLSAETVQITYFRLDAVHEPLDGSALEDAAHDLGQTVQSLHRRDHSLGAGVARDTVVMKAHRVHVGLPVVEHVIPATVGSAYASRLASAARTPGWAVKFSLGDSSYTSSHVKVIPSKGKIEDETVDNYGTRRTTIKTTVSIEVFERIGLHLDATIARVARGLEGITVTGAGRIEDVDYRVSWGERGETGRVELTTVLVSKVPA
jgi:hypothetical protein